MTDVYVDLRGRRARDLEPVRAGLDQLEGQDSLYVIISRLDTDEANRIASLLRSEGLQVQTKGGQDEEFILQGFLPPKERL